MNLSLILRNICSFLPTPLSVKKGNRFFKKVLLRESKRVVSLCLKFDEKNLQDNFSLVDISKIICFQFFDPHNLFSSNLNTTSLKIFPKHGGIYIFDTKFSKNFGERLWDCVRLPFCWSKPGNWHILWKIEGSRTKGDLILK